MLQSQAAKVGGFSGAETFHFEGGNSAKAIGTIRLTHDPGVSVSRIVQKPALARHAGMEQMMAMGSMMQPMFGMHMPGCPGALSWSALGVEFTFSYFSVSFQISTSQAI